ncbi:glycosyltransferase family 10 domain-containing protein [Avibacterium paragallinarum]|uniref:glycosyltransferase family 10 domain-containing protein n=4 Tax=Avibacterium paragallinarum TaxID=728 RepID=UPI000696B47B|nr:glycosyltransferase family 10 [Avibacterium paragallinarum]AZI14894.1 glycosyltransferase [Avibacterium paragallinarum]QIR12327.1 glycosyltransferase [Avibacterium paragallinarum]QJE10350.1 glycosyltransferase [Avibacterium paragallinarum]QJE12543.1 glycosyltransferase [Avibacterium paragallinarum]QJE14747.1 glycosyltransferase [Avibacterium paragallinarum]
MSIKVRFVDFWNGFNCYDNIITDILTRRGDIEIIENGEPDLLIYSCFGNKHFEFNNCTKLYCSGENDVPNFNFCDYAISYHYLEFSNRHLRLPLFNLQKARMLAAERSKADIDSHLESFIQRKFCSIVVSNSLYADPIRDRFWNLLNQYKEIASGGGYKNNVGEPVKDKLEFIKGYKFNIAFENSMVSGYTTEKIIEPCIVNTVPIYWGNRLVAKDFNPEAFIDISDFDSLDRAVDYVIKVDNDPELYTSYLKANLLNRYPYLDYEEIISNFFNNIIDNGMPVFRTKYGRVGIFLKEIENIKEPTSNNIFKKIFKKFI